MELDRCCFTASATIIAETSIKQKTGSPCAINFRQALAGLFLVIIKCDRILL